MYKIALSSLTVLYFMMGFITCLNDILIPYLKEIFELTFAQAALVQFCFFGAYGLMSIPSSKILEKVGYQNGMVIGFSVTALGCVLFYPAVLLHTYGIFLVALFILATGVVILQVAANPYVSIIGPQETASSRLTMVQALNSLGTFLAPFFGSYLILSNLTETKDAEAGASAVIVPYFIIALVLVIIAFALSRLKLPVITNNEANQNSSWKKVLKNSGLIYGMVGIFAYVGAEVAIGSFLVNYVISITPMSEAEAASLVAMYWGATMVGRFLGIFTLRSFSPGRVLAVHAFLAIAFILISIYTTGWVSIYSLILVGLCNSVMFPVIFTVGIKGLSGGEEQKGSGLLATAILGGAIVPVLTGELVDAMGFSVAFLLPALCYTYIAFLGLKNHNVRLSPSGKSH